MFIIYGCTSPYYQKGKNESGQRDSRKIPYKQKLTTSTKISDLLPKKHRFTDPGRVYQRKTLKIAVLLIIYYYEIIAFVRSFSAMMFNE